MRATIIDTANIIYRDWTGNDLPEEVNDTLARLPAHDFTHRLYAEMLDATQHEAVEVAIELNSKR